MLSIGCTRGPKPPGYKKAACYTSFSSMLLLSTGWLTCSASAQTIDCDGPIDVIEEQLRSQNQPLAYQAAICFGAEPMSHADAFQALADVISLPKVSEQVKEASVWAAGRIVENRKVSADIAADLAGELIPLVQDSSQQLSLRKASAYTLGRLSESLTSVPAGNGPSAAKQSVDALSQLLTDPGDAWTAKDQLLLIETAAEAVGHYGHQGIPAVPDIARLLRISQSTLQREKNLTKGQKETILHVQAVMANTLGESPADPTSSESGLALLGLLKQEDNASLQAALYALGNLGPRPEIQDGASLIVVQMESGDSAIRRVTAYALGRIHAKRYQAETIRALAVALSDREPRVREAAAEAIDEFDTEDSFSTLPTLAAAIVAEDDSEARTSLLRVSSSIAGKEADSVNPADRGGAINVLNGVQAKLEQTKQSLQKTDPSYGPVLYAIDVVGQSVASIRGRRLRELFTSHPAIAGWVVGYLVWVGICMALFRWSPFTVLHWNQILGKAVDLDIPLPLSLGRIKIPLRYALFIGFLNYRSRVLNAWVHRYAGCVKKSLLQRQTVQERQVYVPLPVSMRNSQTTRISALKPEDLRDVCSQDRWCLRILGEGGCGKTSLACQLAFWCLAEDPSQRICPQHRSVPILLEPGNMTPVEAGASTLSEIIRSQLQAAAHLADPIEPGLFDALVKTKRVVVIIDGASEMENFTRPDRQKLEETFPACAVIVTARSSDPFEEGGYVDILPQRIDSDHLIPFMNAYLSHLNIRIDDSGLYEACRRLAVMVGKERGITPLLAQMFAHTFVRVPDIRSTGPYLPTCVPELMLNYIEVLNRAGRQDKWQDLEVLRVSKRLAWECIRDTFQPSRVSKEEVIDGKLPGVLSNELFAYLEVRLRLLDTIAGANFQFVLDPLAEYLAATYIMEQNRGDEASWKQLLDSFELAGGSGRDVVGFIVAMNDCLKWKQTVYHVPHSIVDYFAGRLDQARDETKVEVA